MDNDRIKGVALKVKGSIKQAVGKMIGSTSLENEGRIDRAAGSARKAVGEAKDIVRDVAKDQ